MTVSLTIAAGLLQEALSPVSALVTECKLQTDSDGIQIRAVDPANVGMVDMSLDASACAHYDCGDHVLGLDLERLESVIGMADSEEMVQLVLNEDTRKLSVEAGSLSFSMGLIDPDSVRSEPDIPDLDLPGVYVLPARELSRAVTAADLCSDHIKMVGESADCLRFDAEGDTDDVRVAVRDDLLSGIHDSDDAIASLFSLEYLDDMTGPMAAETEVSVLLGDEMPVKLQWSFADGDGSVTNMLAPRIQSE